MVLSKQEFFGMNNNQTTADTTAETTTVTAPSAETTTTTTTTTTAEKTTTTTETATSSEVPDTTTTGTTFENDFYGEKLSSAAGFSIDGTKNAKKTDETFSAVDCTITIDGGNTFTIAHTSVAITLENNIITNNSPSAFINATDSTVALTLKNQVAEGDIILDNLSSLSLVFSGSSYYMGTINGGNIAKSATVSLDATSQLILAGDTYLTTLENADTTNMNIYSNGYKLYVSGEEVAVNGSEAPAAPEVVIEEQVEEEATETVQPSDKSANVQKATDYTPFIVGGAAILVIILAVIAFMIHNKKKNAVPAGPIVDAPAPGAPDFSQFDDGPVAQPQPPMQPGQPAEPQAPEAPASPETPVEPTNGSPINPFHPNA